MDCRGIFIEVPLLQLRVSTPYKFGSSLGRRSESTNAVKVTSGIGPR